MKYLSYRILFCCTAFFLITSSALAQYQSDQGYFEVNAKEGCLGTTISITADNCTNCSDFDFGAGESSYGLSYQYTSPGTYVIKALASGGFIPDSVTINIYPDTIPQFSIYRCAARSVEVKINDNNYDNYKIEWGDGNQSVISPPDTEEQYTYASTGNFNIKVTGQYDLGSGNDDCNPNEQTVTVDNNLPIATITEIYPLRNLSDRLVIKYSAPENAIYKLQLAINSSNNWIPAQDISPTADSIVIANLLLDQNFYCFRIVTLDACQPGNPPNAFSPALCTQDLDISFTDNEENILAWRTANTAATDFTILINENENATSQNFAITRRSYSHTQVTCNLNYCYTLVTNYPDGATVRSLEKCGTAELNTMLPSVTDAATVVSGDQINLDWQAAYTIDDISFYTLYRSAGGGNFNEIATEIPESEYIDNGLSPDQTAYCYQISYTDRCDNVSPRSSNICPLFLTATEDSRYIFLSWNSYEGYSAGTVSYQVDKFDENGNLIASFVTDENSYTDTLQTADPQIISYRITAVPVDGNLSNSISNLLNIARDAVLAVPNAFTPGSNNENSIFRIVTPFLSGIDLKIFNRWGQLVFHSTDPDIGWSGNDYNGNPLPKATYIYKAILQYESGETRNISGSVLLLRR